MKEGYTFRIRSYREDCICGTTALIASTWEEMIERYNRLCLGAKLPENVTKIYYKTRIGEERIPLVRKSEGIAIYYGTMPTRTSFKCENKIFPSLRNTDNIHPGIIKFNRMKRTYFAKKVSVKLRNQHRKLEILNELHREYTGLSMSMEVRRLILKNMY